MAQQTLSGSCLCGGLRYEVEGEPTDFYHCHCSRCRKVSGTAHASNIMVKGDTLRWSGDESQIHSYKVPESELFVSAFCATCGSPLPQVLAGYGVVFIPAGTLDSEPDVAPNARIYHGSRAAWSCEDALPTFDEMPEDS